MAQAAAEPSPPTADEGERKFGVALFADLSGYTALCQRLDPEEVERTIRPLMRALRSSVADAGGSVMSVAGDGFFAMFGVPRAVPDATQRALEAALTMCDLIAGHVPEPGISEVPDVHVGIASGEILIMPGDDGQGLSLVGRAINLASRLCDAAGPGEVLVDEETKLVLGQGASWESSRALEIQGHAEPVTAWTPSAGGPVRRSSYREPSFVGREELLAKLDAALSRGRVRRTSEVVDLVGDAGIGKSRLVREWLSSQALAHVSLVCSADGGQRSALDLLNAIAADQPASIAELEVLLESASAGPRGSVQRPDPAATVHASLRRLLEAAASAGPLAVVIDDYDDADVSLRKALDAFTTDPIPAGVLFIVIQRVPEAAVSVRQRLDVGPMTADEVTALIQEVLQGPAGPLLQQAIADRVQGNPLMAVHSASYLVESGAVQRTDNVWDLHERDEVNRLPGSLQMFIGARIDALPAPAKAVLRSLSSFGEPIDVDVISSVLGKNALDALPFLHAAGLLSELRPDVLRFRHRLVREVAYASLTRRSRAQLHERQLAVLPANSAPSLRAYHAVGWHETVGRGTPETTRAGIAALRESRAYAEDTNRSSAAAAHGVISAVRPILDEHAASAPALVVSIQLLDSQCLLEIGDFEAALSAAARAAQTARMSRSRADAMRCLTAQGAALSRLQRYEAARQALDEAARTAEELQDLGAKARALWLMGETWRHSVFRRFTALTEEAYGLYLGAGDETGAGECARLLTYLLSSESVVVYSRWSEVAQNLTKPDDIRGQAWLARAEAFAASAQLDWAEAREAAERAVTYGEQIGAVDISFEGMTKLVTSQAALGDTGGALRTAVSMLDLAARSSNPRMRAVASAYSAHVFLRAGNRERAVEEMRTAREVLPSLGSVEIAILASAEGELAHLQGRWSQAIEALSAEQIAAHESGNVLLSLLPQIEQRRIQLDLGWLVPGLDTLLEQANQAGAGHASSFVQALIERRDLAASGSRPAMNAVSGGLDEQGFRADTAALWAELADENPTERWEGSVAVWERLGVSVRLARAQARVGDRAAAVHTLELLDSPVEARDWALNGPTSPGATTA